jgi:hypothetical protein
MPINESRLSGLQSLIGQQPGGDDGGFVGGQFTAPWTAPAYEPGGGGAPGTGQIGGGAPPLTSDPGYPNPGGGKAAPSMPAPSRGMIDNPAYPGGTSAVPRDYTGLLAKGDAPRMPDPSMAIHAGDPGYTGRLAAQQLADAPRRLDPSVGDYGLPAAQTNGPDMSSWGAPSSGASWTEPGAGAGSANWVDPRSTPGGLQRLLGQKPTGGTPPAVQNLMGQVPAPGGAPGLPPRPSAFSQLRAQYGGPGSQGWRAYKKQQGRGAIDALRGR